LVVIDTPPILMVSDAIPLLGQASGVVLVARLGSTTGDAIRRFSEVIANTGGVLLGVVATDAKAGSVYGYEGQAATAADEGGPNGRAHGAGQSPTRRRFAALRGRR
jgi:Mrp family chromosome partitioning ATPase